MKDRCFHGMAKKCTITKELLEYAKREDHNWSEFPDVNGYTFNQIKVPYEIASKDELLQYFAAQKEPSIYRMDPWSYYVLHKDSKRKSALNLALEEGYDSCTFFDLGAVRRNQLSIYELDYQPDTY